MTEPLSTRIVAVGLDGPRQGRAALLQFLVVEQPVPGGIGFHGGAVHGDPLHRKLALLLGLAEPLFRLPCCLPPPRKSMPTWPGC